MARILVVGLPRAGTSWTGRVVGRARGAVFVHEPDGEHEPFAVRAKRGHGRHIVLDPNDEAPEYERLWAGAFAGGRRTPNLRGRVAERLFETAPLRDRAAARRGEPVPPRLRLALALAVPHGSVSDAQHVVVKSVHAALAVEWIVQRFAPRVLVVERDPRNVLASWLDLGMGGDRIENAALGSFALQRWGVAPPPADAPKVVQRAFVYGVLASGLRDAASRHPDWVVASHDELCVDPRVRFGEVFERLGLEWSDDATAYLEGSNRAGEGFRTQRVTADQPDKWQEKLDADAVAQLTAELARFPFDLLR